MTNRANQRTNPRANHRANLRVLFLALSIVAAMGILTAYSATLYRLFCEVTGFGGTPMTSVEVNELANPADAKPLRVSFDTSQSPTLQWRITNPEPMDITSGSQLTFYYTAENLTQEAIKGMSVFNVTPQGIAPYVNKIACFCFEEQTLEAGENRKMRVDFYISSDLFKEPRFRNLSNITFSYSFFEA